MNIKRAKEEIEHTVKAYLAKDALGEYAIPAIRQRPILLMGPPGIGKTQVMEQVARECGVALVAYTITHHTRQSAVGLPFIRQRNYGGKDVSVTEYTMSEIIASIYAKMEATGLSEGILFIDEINCVSETLAPTMLQFLQCKTFGNQAVPAGWVIVAAGNPPEYNKSVRDFDIVTLDRVRRMDIEPDLPVWKDYARAAHIHSAILSYLELHPQNFYQINADVDGTQFVTARGWEDLSNLLDTYEQLGLQADEDLIKEYIGHSWYVGDSDLNPREGVTEPEFTEYYKAGTLREENGHEIGDINDRYSWSKAPSYDGKCMEAGPFSRVLAAYLRGNEFVKPAVDGLCADLGLTIPQLQSTLGRVAARNVEPIYIAECMVEWVDELIEAVKGGDSEYFRTPETITGEGMGLWEAPRGALLHTEKVNNGKITDYQIIIPTTWNIAPRNAEGVQGPMEQALIGTPVADVDMPINALRTVHSFDPCTACAVHVTEPSTGKHFETVTSPWGVK